MDFYDGIGWDLESGVSIITCTSCCSNYSVNVKIMNQSTKLMPSSSMYSYELDATISTFVCIYI